MNNVFIGSKTQDTQRVGATSELAGAINTLHPNAAE